MDACRVGRTEGDRTEYGRDRHLPHANTTASLGKFAEVTPYSPHDAGRWPANVVLDETQADALDEQSGQLASGDNCTRTKVGSFLEHGGLGKPGDVQTTYGDTGGASRFFPTFQSDPCDVCGEDMSGWHRDGRDEHVLAHVGESLPTFRYEAKAPQSERPKVNGTAHPTVKPLALMRWLVRLVTPPGGTVLEPFAGSGTTVEACILEGFHCIAIEKGAEYLPLIESRIARRRDPVRAVELSGDDAGLFDFLEGEATA